MTHCPRCGVEWDGHRCKPCNIEAYLNIGVIWLHLRDNVSMRWILGAQRRCEIHRDGQNTVIPIWLPYTITLEDLVKYLVLL
jgi:hypothetical protein